MAFDPAADRGRPIVTHVRVGRGMVKVTKYENEQPKSPSDTNSLRSSHSSTDRSTPTPGPSHRWLRRPRMHKSTNKRAPSAHRSRSRSSGRSLQTIRRASAYMHSDVDLTSTERRVSHDGTTSPARGGAEPQGVFSLNSAPIPIKRGDQTYDRRYRPPTSPTPEHRGQELRTSPLSISPTNIHRSVRPPSAQSWTTDSEIDPTADTEMWSSISRLEDELISKFGRGVVPPLTALRQEKSSAPPQASTGPRDRNPSLPDKLTTANQRQASRLHTIQSQNTKLVERFHEPITASALPPRQVHRARSTPALAFPLPPPTLPAWVTDTPLPAPGPYPNHLSSSSSLLRAKNGPPPPFAPPPDFPPPPPPAVSPEDRDTEKDLEALKALYQVLEAGYRSGTIAPMKPQPRVDKTTGVRRLVEPGITAKDLKVVGPRRKVSSGPKPYEGRAEVVPEEGEVTPSRVVAHAY